MAEFKFKSAFFPDVVRPLLHASDMPGTSTLLEYEGPCGDDRAICFTVSRVIENKEPKGGVHSRCLLGGRKGRCAPQCSVGFALLISLSLDVGGYVESQSMSPHSHSLSRGEQASSSLSRSRTGTRPPVSTCNLPVCLNSDILSGGYDRGGC